MVADYNMTAYNVLTQGLDNINCNNGKTFNQSSPPPKIDMLLEKLRYETTELIEQGDDLTYQMHKLYKGVHTFVSDNLLGSSQEYNDDSGKCSSSPNDKKWNIIFGDNQDLENANDQIRRNGSYQSYRMPVRNDSNDLRGLQKHGKMKEKSHSRVRYSPFDQIYSPVNRCHKQTTDSYQQSVAAFTDPFYSNYNLMDNLGMPHNLNCISPVTTLSSGYSSDKDISLPDERLNDDHDCGAAEDSVLLPTNNMDDSIICCDKEITQITKQCNETNVSDNKSKSCDFVIEPDQLYDGSKINRHISKCFKNDNRYSSLPFYTTTESSFKPIVVPDYENNVSINLHNGKKSDSFTVMRQSMKDIVRDLNKSRLSHSFSSTTCNGEKNNKVSRHHSLYEKRSKEYVCLAQSSANPNATPPPITSLPGFHPSWCSSLNKHHLKPYNFSISQNSAFQPYRKGRVNKSRSCFTEKSLEYSFEAPVTNFTCSSPRKVYETKQNENQSFYALKQNHDISPCLKVDRECINSSQCYNNSLQSPYTEEDSSTDDDDNSVIYERIDDPLYDPAGALISKQSKTLDTPPKLPKRNSNSKYYQTQATDSRKTTRRHTLKLEDIIRPSDVIHSGGIHMYTVADILKSVDNMNKDIPAPLCQGNLYSPEPKKQNLSNIRRTISFHSLQNTQSTYKSLQECEGKQSYLKTMRSPIKPKSNECCTAQTKRLCKVEENPTELNFSHSPNTPTGFFAIPTKYGLQFKSQASSPNALSRSMSNLSLNSKQVKSNSNALTNCNKPVINWVTQNTGNEIFC